MSYERHGMAHSPCYKSWEMMVQRCTNPDFDSYRHYGGRGIKMQDSWSRFSCFLADMGERPEGMSLDRVDVNGDYCKENCKWSDQTEQMYNKRFSEKNTSGRTGVGWHKKAGKWYATIQHKGVQYHLGLFSDFDSAVSARVEAELKFYGKARNK